MQRRSRRDGGPIQEGVAPAPRLLFIGVLSFNASGRLGRRNALRRLLATSPLATLRFCLPADEPDGDTDRDDVLRLSIPASRRATHGKFFLHNALLRFAFTRGHAFVARADDDALFNPPAVVAHLQELQALELGVTDVVYGVQKLWYRWHEETLQPVCWDQSWARWARAFAANRTADACLQRGLVGPFPFASGPFVAYSRALLGRLLPLVAEGERRVLGERSHMHMSLGSEMTGMVARPEKRSPPANRVFLEDVYMGSLVYRLHRTAALTLVDVTMAEFVGRQPPTGSAHIYHRLKHPRRFEILANESRRYGRRWERETRLRCAPLRETDGSGARRKCAKEGLPLQHCCLRWQTCFPSFRRESLVEQHAGWCVRPKAVIREGR